MHLSTSENNEDRSVFFYGAQCPTGSCDTIFSSLSHTFWKTFDVRTYKCENQFRLPNALEIIRIPSYVSTNPNLHFKQTFINFLISLLYYSNKSPNGIWRNTLSSWTMFMWTDHLNKYKFSSDFSNVTVLNLTKYYRFERKVANEWVRLQTEYSNAVVLVYYFILFQFLV